MQELEAKLAKWTELYGRLKNARARLKLSIEDASPQRDERQAEVHELQRLCGQALDELQAEYARMKTGDSRQ
jgi:uncharacterized coiled-coil DUF342 family protein